jgi:pyruvate dehydrogenase E2 component (dihydrolipoamide acetyltransferase)
MTDETKPAADAPHDDFGPVGYQPLSRIQLIGGARLQAAWSRIPHVTHFDEADVTALEAGRKQRNESQSGTRLTLLTWVARACVDALREHPRFCASLDEEGRRVMLKRYVNLGVAVDTPMGLVVAVVHGADRLSLDELGAAIADLAERGRLGKLKPTELEGTCFTISSLGGLGGTGFTPIINPPDVAILGVSPARVRPEWIAGAVEPRLILPLSLSYDHRVISGADAARFCTYLRQQLADGHGITPSIP